MSHDHAECKFKVIARTAIVPLSDAVTDYTGSTSGRMRLHTALTSFDGVADKTTGIAFQCNCSTLVPAGLSV